MSDERCMKYIHKYKCAAPAFSCHRCPYQLTDLVKVDDVRTLITLSTSKDEMLTRLADLNKVSTEYLSTTGAEKLAGSEV